MEMKLSEWEETNKKEFRIEKVTTEMAINYMFNGKDAIICLIAEQIKC